MGGGRTPFSCSIALYCFFPCRRCSASESFRVLASCRLSISDVLRVSISPFMRSQSSVLEAFSLDLPLSLDPKMLPRSVTFSFRLFRLIEPFSSRIEMTGVSVRYRIPISSAELLSLAVPTFSGENNVVVAGMCLP